MRKILFILAILAIMLAVDAREPKVGDFVHIALDANGEASVVNGIIKNISNGLVCVEARMFKQNDQWVLDDRCIGTGQIVYMNWPEKIND